MIELLSISLSNVLSDIFLLLIGITVLLVLDYTVANNKISAFIGTIGIWLSIPIIVVTLLGQSFVDDIWYIHSYFILIAIAIYFIASFIPSMIKTRTLFTSWIRVVITDYWSDVKESVRFKHKSILIVPGVLYILYSLFGIIIWAVSPEGTEGIVTFTFIMLIMLMIGLVMLISGIRIGKSSIRIRKRIGGKKRADEIERTNEIENYWKNAYSKQIPLDDILSSYSSYEDFIKSDRMNSKMGLPAGKHMRFAGSGYDETLERWEYRGIATDKLKKLLEIYPGNEQIIHFLELEEIRTTPLTAAEKEAIRRDLVYGSPAGGPNYSDYMNTPNQDGNTGFSSQQTQYDNTASPSTSSVIRDTDGNLVGRLDNQHIRDVHGNWQGDIRNGRFYDTGGNYVGEFRGEHLFDSNGVRQGELRGKHFYDIYGNWQYTLE